METSYELRLPSSRLPYLRGVSEKLVGKELPKAHLSRTGVFEPTPCSCVTGHEDRLRSEKDRGQRKRTRTVKVCDWRVDFSK